MWGAIGDYYWYLAFLYPLLQQYRDHWVVMAADVYPRYKSDPLGDLCLSYRLIDELWLRPRQGAGPTCVPPEYLQQALEPDPNITMYTPAVWYDKFLVGPGVVPVPTDWLIEHHRLHPKFLAMPMSDIVFKNKFNLPNRYITLQPITTGKRSHNVVPDTMMSAVDKIDAKTVVMRFPGDHRLSAYFSKHFAGRENVQVVDCAGPVDAFAIHERSRCHVGVESSQVLGATIHDIPALWFPVGGLSQFIRDLSIGPLCCHLPWESSATDIVSAIERMTDGEVARR
jgi:hypothetical protein